MDNHYHWLVRAPEYKEYKVSVPNGTQKGSPVSCADPLQTFSPTSILHCPKRALNSFTTPSPTFASTEPQKFMDSSHPKQALFARLRQAEAEATRSNTAFDPPELQTPEALSEYRRWRRMHHELPAHQRLRDYLAQKRQKAQIR